MKKSLLLVALIASLVSCSATQKKWERSALEITDKGCILLHDVEPAPVRELCDYEHQILPYLETTLLAKGNKSLAARAPASASAAPSSSAPKK